MWETRLHIDGRLNAVVHGNPNTLFQGALLNSAPRLASRSTPPDKATAAIRGGYGIFYEHLNGNEGISGHGRATRLHSEFHSVQRRLAIPTSAVGGFGGTHRSSPQLLSVPRYRRSGLTCSNGTSTCSTNPSQTVVTAAYVGSKGTHLAWQREFNQLYPVAASQDPLSPVSQLPLPTAAVLRLLRTALPSPPLVLARPIPLPNRRLGQQFGCGLRQHRRSLLPVLRPPKHHTPGGSGELQLQRPASSGRKSVGSLNLTAAYTYSHSIDNASDRYDGTFVNSYDPSLARASSNFDQRHMLNAGWVYDIPLFKKAGLTHSLLGGWQWSGIESFSTGLPVTVNNGTTMLTMPGLVLAVSPQPRRILIESSNTGIPPASLVSSASQAKYDFNPGAFALPQGLTFGNAGRNDVRNPRLNFDMGIFKHFAIKESAAIEFRAEAFNIFNHTQFSLSDVTAGSSGGFTNSMTCAGGPTTRQATPAVSGREALPSARSRTRTLPVSCNSA